MLRTMRAVVCKEFAPISSLVIEERPDPSPGPGTVLVGVRAAGVNYVDGLFLPGKYQINQPVPLTPVVEVAGDGLAVAAGGDWVARGALVLAMSFPGASLSPVGVPAPSGVPLR